LRACSLELKKKMIANGKKFVCLFFWGKGGEEKKEMNGDDEDEDNPFTFCKEDVAFQDSPRSIQAHLMRNLDNKEFTTGLVLVLGEAPLRTRCRPRNKWPAFYVSFDKHLDRLFSNAAPNHFVLPVLGERKESVCENIFAALDFAFKFMSFSGGVICTPSWIKTRDLPRTFGKTASIVNQGYYFPRNYCLALLSKASVGEILELLQATIDELNMDTMEVY
jgi:hypothetical protein